MPVAETYHIDRDVIYPGDVWQMTTGKSLADPDAFLTFARLAARGNPSESKILEWVHRHGLLRRRDPDCAELYTVSGEPNQEPMDLWDFREETRRAYRLLHLFELWRGSDVEALRSRMEVRPMKKGKRFAQVVLDGEPLARWVPKDGGLTDDAVLFVAKRAVEAGVALEIAGVQPVFGLGRLVLRVPDLKTGMYWAFAALVAGKQASALCEVCGNLFTKRRRDHRICSSTCRSSQSRENKRLREANSDTT